MMSVSSSQWWIWRHPRAQEVAGRCIGKTDVGIDRRRAKRLARRIQRVARVEKLSHVVWTSPLKRAHAVGAMLARWGWRHEVMGELSEADFGEWDGRLWADIDRAEVDAWCADFAHHAPGGGESVKALWARCHLFMTRAPAHAVCVVGHAGWMIAAYHLAHGLPMPREATQWPLPPPHGGLMVLPVAVSSGTVSVL